MKAKGLKLSSFALPMRSQIALQYKKAATHLRAAALSYILFSELNVFTCHVCFR